MNELKTCAKCLVCGKPALPRTAPGRGGRIVETAGAIGIDPENAVCLTCYETRSEEAEQALAEAEGRLVITQGKRLAADVTAARDDIKRFEEELAQAKGAVKTAEDRLAAAVARLAGAEQARDRLITAAKAAEQSARAAQLAAGASYASGKAG